MSRTPRIFILIALLILTVGVSASVSAQATEEADLRMGLHNTLESFVKAGNYHYATNISISLHNTDGNHQIKPAYYLYTLEGDVLSNSEYHDIITLKTGVSKQTVETNPALHEERIVTGGKTYLNIQPTSGWIEVDAAVLAQNSGIADVVRLPIPSQSRIDTSLVESVTAGEIESINGIDTRRYDLKVNGLGLLLAGLDTSGQAALRQTLRSLRLVAASTFDATEQIWIGVQDGKLYRGSLESHTVIPFVSYGIQDAPPYDLDQTTRLDFTISYPTQSIVITPPDSRLIRP